jgi:hypothetical protein
VLKHPDKFMPLTTESGFQALVSAGFQGDFRFTDASSGEAYLNRFAEGTRFYKVIVSDLFGNRDYELVMDRELIHKLQEAKNKYIELYFVH